MPTPLTDALAWITVAVFVAGAMAQWRDRDTVARYVFAVAFGVFGVFWLALVPHFAFTQKSIVEGLLSAAAVPASLYTGYLIYDGRDSLMVLGRAIAVMGLIYLPANVVVAIERPLIEAATVQADLLMNALGYHPEVIQGTENPYRSMFVIDSGYYHKPFFTEVLLACTGIGSITIFAGLISAIDAPIGRKLLALGVVVPIIWTLNVIRVAFITLAFSYQWFQVFIDEVMWLFGTPYPTKVSYYVADRVIAQSLSVVALIAIAWIIVKIVPEVLTVFEDVLYLLTGSEYDLEAP